jgi:uncharacterized membrane protein HdeD (DUF308 family)
MGAGRDITRNWWLFLITGIAWFLISLVVLRFNTSSLVAVGVLLGVLFLMAGVNEFFVGGVRRSWRWAHYLLGVFFLLGALWAFVTPINAFWALASVLGFLLIFKGTLDIVTSSMSRGANPMWGLGLAAGILEVLLGFWASQQFFPARAALILIWVGFMALFRGFSEIILAFQLRHADRDLQAA